MDTVKTLAPGFNTQPPEGGWILSKSPFYLEMSFNTQPPEGGWKFQQPLSRFRRCFNTQPPEGGWAFLPRMLAVSLRFQHTAA